MEQTKIDLFIATNSNKFNQSDLYIICERLAALDDSRYGFISSLQFKDPTILLIFSLFFGSIGVDRFILGETGLGVLKLLTCGGCGIWTIIDWFFVMDKTREKNFETFMIHASM